MRTVTRKVMDKRGNGEMVRFQIIGLSSGAASRVADMMKYNLEVKKGVHQKPYKQSDFDAVGEFEVVE